MTRETLAPDHFITWRIAGEREADLTQLHTLEDMIRDRRPIPDGMRERFMLALRRVRLNEYPARTKPRAGDRNFFLATHTWLLRRCMRDLNAANKTGTFARKLGIKGKRSHGRIKPAKYDSQTAVRNATRHKREARAYIAKWLADGRTKYTRHSMHRTLRAQVEECVRIAVRYGV